MVDSVKVLSSVKRNEIINNFSVKRLGVLVAESDFPKYSLSNTSGLLEDERYRFVNSSKDLVSMGMETNSEAFKFISGALKAKGKFANFPFLPSLTADLEVFFIVKKDSETAVESLTNAIAKMNFGFYDLVIAKSLYPEVMQILNVFAGEYMVWLEDDQYFIPKHESGVLPTEEDLEMRAFFNTSTRSEFHFFDDVMKASLPVSLNFQMPKERSEVELPIAAVAASYEAASFGTERPGVSAYFKTLEGVSADFLPSTVIDKIDLELERKINTYRANEGNAYKWNNLANGESAEVSRLVRYAESVITANNQNLLKSAISYDDDGFMEIKTETERFFGTLLRAKKITAFEVECEKYSSLSAEDREKQRYAYKATLTICGVVKELDLFAVWSK